MYRKFLMGTLMAMGIGLMGISGSTATPVSGSALLNATADTSPVEQVHYYGQRGYYGRGYYGRGYYGRGYYGHRGYYGPGYYGPGYYGRGYYGGCILGVLC
jgi:hypothetical protein